MVPYLVTTLSFENLYLYLHNVNADPCYMLPNFLTQVGKQIIDACDEVDTLEKQYFAVQWETRDLNLTANKYRDCEIGTKPGYATLPIFDNLDSAAEVLNGSYPASTCNQKTMIELAAKFSRAPGWLSRQLLHPLISCSLLNRRERTGLHWVLLRYWAHLTALSRVSIRKVRTFVHSYHGSFAAARWMYRNREKKRHG